jgi:CRISPR/Cas system-associated exonuclease Cas4 (RecB family)
MSYPVIKASEIAEYVYCGRAWWLRVKVGYAPNMPERLVRGTIHHRQHGADVARATLARRVALGLLFVAVSVFAFWLIRTI